MHILDLAHPFQAFVLQIFTHVIYSVNYADTSSEILQQGPLLTVLCPVHRMEYYAIVIWKQNGIF